MRNFGCQCQIPFLATWSQEKQEQRSAEECLVLGGGAVDSDRCPQINAFVRDVIMVQMESVRFQSYTPWIQSPMPPPFPKVKQQTQFLKTGPQSWHPERTRAGFTVNTLSVLG